MDRPGRGSEIAPALGFPGPIRKCGYHCRFPGKSPMHGVPRQSPALIGLPLPEPRQGLPGLAAVAELLDDDEAVVQARRGQDAMSPHPGMQAARFPQAT